VVLHSEERNTKKQGGKFLFSIEAKEMVSKEFSNTITARKKKLKQERGDP
jgi:hypothetical protein